MENFIVSARKYRPTTFDMVVGQESITGTLKNAIKTNHLSQSYLFCGPRGVGKTTCARILAKTINCQNITANTEACDECESCKSFNTSRSFNIHELDAASNNKVDDIRNLTDQVRIPPQVGKYSIYIIDEVHMLSTSAFNAFLKTLEEPPRHAIFILATTEKQKIIPTILSRCQIFDFHRITIDDITDRLAFVAGKEGIEAEREGLHIIAQKADGAMRDALSIFDQIVSFSGSNITYSNVIENLNVLDYEYYLKITDAFLRADISTSLVLFNEILEKGFDGHNFIGGLASHFRSLLVCKDEVTIKLMEVGSSIKERYLNQTKNCPAQFLYMGLDLLGTADITYKSSRNQRLHVELTLIKLCNLNRKAENQQDEDSMAPPEEKRPYIKPEKSRTDKPGEEKQDRSKPDETTEEESPDIKVTSADKPVSLSFSIKDNLNKAEKEAEKNNTESLEEEEKLYDESDFDKDDFSNAWLKYGETVKEKSARMSSIIKAMKPEIDDKGLITLFLKTDAQKEYIDTNYKQGMIDYLKKELNNSSIDLRTFVEEESSDPTPYTLQQKYDHLRNKNPSLDKFKKDFSLDFD
ncbi:MAG: DNA polymerase III subunit gamma/tau [Marinilabiliaceae bacterium]|jgi:DNA polymerase-3 subunit gamma/tau|nr:DNA polymerase III subunit gamma/tau [Marinilabiliaceae bacterium]